MERLSGLDASFLYMETPQVQMHVAFAVVLDPKELPGGYSFQAVTERVAEKIRRKSAFRRRLVQVPLNLHHPLWIEDPDFDIIHHVRQVALPDPGGLEELGQMVGRINSTPLDRRRPLWELWVIEGLENGRFALFLKFHHASVDGVSGAALLHYLLDTEAEPAPLPPAPPVAYEPLPTDGQLVAYGLRSRLLNQPRAFFPLVSQTVQSLTGVIRRRIDPEMQDGATPLQAPRTHFNQAVTARRNLAFARIPLADIKAVKNVLGVTVNDVVLTVAGGALRRYLDRRGALPSDPLTAVCPISVRTKSQAKENNNRVSAMFVELGTHIEDPVERASAINAVTQGAKEEHNAMGAHMLQDWAEFAAPSTFSLAMRLYSNMHLASRHRPVHNLVVSNVPGPRFALYFAGAKVDVIYPIGPVMEGAGLNLTVMSYRGSVDFSFNVDSALMPDVWELAEMVEGAFAALQRGAGIDVPAEPAPASNGHNTGRPGATAEAPKKARARAPSGPAPPKKKAAKRTPKKAAKKRAEGEEATQKRASARARAGATEPASGARRTRKKTTKKAPPKKSKRAPKD